MALTFARDNVTDDAGYVSEREYLSPLRVAAIAGFGAQLMVAAGQTTSFGAFVLLGGFYLLLTLATAFCGGALGFLFGLPKEISWPTSAQAEEEPQEAMTDADAPFRSTGIGMHNTNLEQLSDWLTKILLGAGLTQLSQAPSFLIRSSERLAELTQGASAGVILCAIVAYAVIGFAVAFLWAKLRLPRFMKDRDERLRTISDKLARSRNSLFGEAQKRLEEVKKRLVSERGENGPLLEGLSSMHNLNVSTASLSGWTVVDVTPGPAADDPWKGRFGGKAVSAGRRLTAEVIALPENDDFFRILLSVQSEPDVAPLEGAVRYFLHPSFPQEKPVVAVKDGMAKLELIGWGAFTVGVLADQGRTMLELNLADLPSAPLRFRER